MTEYRSEWGTYITTALCVTLYEMHVCRAMFGFKKKQHRMHTKINREKQHEKKKRNSSSSSCKKITNSKLTSTKRISLSRHFICAPIDFFSSLYYIYIPLLRTHIPCELSDNLLSAIVFFYRCVVDWLIGCCFFLSLPRENLNHKLTTWTAHQTAFLIIHEMCVCHA